MPSQPYALACEGGLDKSSSSFELLRRPGAATRLRNFEVDVAGGYRRVNGFSVFGGDSAARPNSSNQVLGLHVYADGVIACSGTNIYFSLDGTSWLQINRDSVAGGGDNYSTFTGRSALARTSQGKAHFATYEGDTAYGEVIITDEGSGVKPFYFKMTGTGALSDRTYFAKEITVDGSVYPKFCTIHDKHLVVGGSSTEPNGIHYSGTSDIDDFSSSGSGTIILDDQVVGLRSFREDLIIFCRNSIWKLSNINNSSTIGRQYMWKSLNQIMPGSGVYRGGAGGFAFGGLQIPFLEEPGFLRPWSDIAFNHDWVGAKITPYGVEKIPPELRVKTNTRESIIQFAEFMKELTSPSGSNQSFLSKVPIANKLINPIEMDYIINSYFTGLMAYPLDLLDAATWKEDKYGERILRRSDEKDISRDPLSIITKRFNLNVPIKSSENIRKLYKIKEEADRVIAGDYEINNSPRYLYDITGMKENYTNEEANEWRVVSELLGDVFTELKLLRELRTQVTKNPNLNAQEKRLEVEKLREAENMIAHSYILMLSQANLDKAFTHLTGGNKYTFPMEPSQVGGVRKGMEWLWGIGE